MKVLVIDQWTALAAALAKRHHMPHASTALETYTFELDHDYEDALDRLADPDRYDAVIVDPYPPVNGEKPGAEYIKRATALVPIVVIVTASWRVDECVQCMRAGAWDFIQKTHGLERIVDLVISSLKSAAKRPVARDLEAEFVNDNLGRLCRDYGGLWIAVSGRNVIEVADTYEQLLVLIQDMPLQPRLWRLPQGWESSDAD